MLILENKVDEGEEVEDYQIVLHVQVLWQGGGHCTEDVSDLVAPEQASFSQVFCWSQY